MTNYWYLLPLAGTLLAGCHASPEQSTEKPAVPTSAAQVVPATTQAVPTGRPYLGYHRYRGTVGGQPVTVELTIEPASDAHDSLACRGGYVYSRHPAGWLQLRAPRPWQPGRPLLLTEADSARPRVATGYWQATQPAGPALSGTWTSPGGKQLPFSLREDYTDGHGQVMAAAYEVLHETVTGPPCRPEQYDYETKAEYRQRLKDLPAASLDREFVHLLGPDTLRPALRRLQCPVPARRHRAMQADLREAGDCASLTDNVLVTYLGYGLLATDDYHELFYQGAAHPLHNVSATVYDLRTGRALDLSEVLKPGTDAALRRLVTPALRREMEASGFTGSEILAPAEGDTATTRLPDTGFGLTEDGLTFQYTDNELGGYAYGMPQVIIPWRELLPLLRPASPVARMLRERGLWRPAPPTRP